MKTLAAKLQSDNYDAVASHTIVHAGFYMIRDGRGELLSSGAVWLDEPVASREKGIDKLQDLIVANMNRAPGGPNVSRPAADHGLKAVRRPHD